MNLLKKVFSRSKVALCISATLALTACGSDPQDGGPGSNSSVSLTGVVIDGYLSNATVYIDADNSGSKDPWEPSAFTDSDGYYSKNEITGVNYCSSTKPEHDKHCLRSKTSFENAVIRIEGGTDILTGQEFIGQMSARAGDLTEGTVDQKVTPLTSLFTEVEENSTEEQALLDALGLEKSQLETDYLNNDSGEVDSKLLNVALKVHKTVTVLSSTLTDSYEDLGTGFGLPNDATSIVYEALADEFIATEEASTNDELTLDKVLLDDSAQDNQLVNILNKAKINLDTVYQDNDKALPDTGEVTQNFTRLAKITNGLTKVTDENIDPSSTLTIQQAKGASSAVEVVVVKTVEAVDEGNVGDDSIDNSIDFFSTPSEALNSVVENLGSEFADTDAATDETYDFGDVDLSDPEAAEQIASVFAIDETTQPFKDMAGLYLQISEEYSERISNGKTLVTDNEFAFFLEGEEDETSGTISLCAKYIEDAEFNNITGKLTLENDQTEGEYIKGSWMLIAPNENGESYSMSITLEYLNNEYAATLKAKGEDNDGNKKYLFTFIGNEGEFSSSEYFEPLPDGETVPTSITECKDRLPLREE